jgi:hypothetical protein
MRKRWSMGVVVAIAVAVSVALASQTAPARAVASADPMRVTVALQSDGLELSVAQGRFVLKLEI